MSKIVVRKYNFGDSNYICDLLNENTKYKRDKAFWVWINRLFGKSIIAIAEYKNKIVGHYAIIPRQCELKDGTLLSCGLGVHAFVLPELRNEISIFEISAVAYKLAKESGIQFIYGFPNKNYRLIQERLEGWKKISLFNSWSKIIQNSIFELNYIWEKITLDSHNILHEINTALEYKKTSKNTFIKSPVHWINRYHLHPQVKYEIWKVINKNEVSFVVCKIYLEEKKRSLHLIDIIESESIIYSKILQDMETLYAKKVDNAIMWPLNEGFQNALMSLGYNNNGFDTFFGIKFLDKNLSKDLFLDISDWNLCMGDSDAF